MSTTTRLRRLPPVLPQPRSLGGAQGAAYLWSMVNETTVHRRQGSARTRIRLLLLALFLVTIPPVLFHRHLHDPLGSDASFLTWRNAFMLDASGLARVWTSDFFGGAMTGAFAYHSGYYRPVTNTFLWVVHHFAGADPLAYNLVEMLLHGVVSALVLLLLFSMGGDLLAAALGAVLFAVHPVNAFAATQPAAVADVLFPVFYVLGLLAFDRALREEGLRGAAPWLAASTLCYAASVLSKEMGITLPAVLVLLVLYRWRRSGTPLRRLGWTLPAWGALGGYLLWRFVMLDLPLHELGYVRRQGAVAVAGAELKSILIHVARVLVPLGPTYPELNPTLVNVIRPPLGDPIVWAGLGVTAALCTGALLWRRHPLVAFWCAFFLVTFTPLLSVDNIAGSLSDSTILTQERWIYLPAVGLLALAGAGAAAFWRGLASPAQRRVAEALAAALVVTLGVSAALHARREDDPFAQLRRLYLFDPSQLSRKELANRYLLYAHWVAAPQGDLAEAEARARRAWQLVPDSPLTARSLALILVQRKEWDEAVRILQPWYRPAPRALAAMAATNPRVYDDLNRTDGPISLLLGRALAHLGKPEEGARIVCSGFQGGVPAAEVEQALQDVRSTMERPGSLPPCPGAGEGPGA